MIAHLKGTIHRLNPEEVTIDVNGVGYRVYVPINVWDELKEGSEALVFIYTHIREDRLDLFGFLEDSERVLFERFIGMNGIGPKLALELSAVPKSLLMQAVGSQEPKLLTTVKGIGKKTAEKLLLDLKSLAESQPEIFGTSVSSATKNSTFDNDAVEALKTLGYDTGTIMNVLKDLSEDLTTTEERITAALRSL
ncbi:Holliday junction branch migration protein RuvA [Candidatus Peregrinibacteria bacterium]|jgi:holliday junction DNA helicase RuvA|nr:Holliday junction branch migration protein RuvA [Candidatus Peregrinibacteria bacterium]MBT5468458.1 Holliday junction branch migration protein RuvA [Candidatus Peregrinibacteria bacterium]MBT7337229.1 Holliday junction branch migration protein RuvA [Candidatus Peregrinibacteria bacterium]MBT7494707.1 Holliday junction branch migration protein RuvA [Candidatus Peribacter sp.]